jgi:membrane protease YdiL (CAAX protease family)
VVLREHLRGHALLFEPRAAPAYGASAGGRLLLIFILMEGVLGPRLHLFEWLGLPMPESRLRVPLMLATAILLVRYAAGVRFAQIGLRRWREWTLTEKSYFVQVVVIATVVFSLVGAVGVTCLLWGFYQELLYRGVLQTELVRRWGGVAGVLAANVLFTFGPLHAYHFAASPPWMIAAIFAIGLFFGVLFHRSRNLALAGVFHGIGACYLAT